MPAISQTAPRRDVLPEAEDGAVRVLAAGSLKAAFGDMSDAVAREGLPDVRCAFGASGLLRDRIAGGETCDVFASANMAHPRAVGGPARPVKVFARNRLCALVREDMDIAPDTLLRRMLDPAVRLGTSTPGADPSGDYAAEVFARAEAIEPGALERLRTKAIALTGGATSRKPDDGRSVYSAIMARRDADIFLTYVTNALAAVRETPGTRIVELPEELAVAAEYGLVVLSDRAAAGAVAAWIMSPAGQGILARHGFQTRARGVRTEEIA